MQEESGTLLFSRGGDFQAILVREGANFERRMDPTQLQPGYRLDRYELLCPLAYGGMASVWLARFGGRLGFERMVVIKMILPQYSQDPRFQEMFLDEARIASKIEHTNVARILDVGEHQDNYFIVMEWVDGDSLSKVLRAAEQRKERIPAGIALRICADAAAGLHAAHELKERDGTPLGVVHRDVSPQNILIGVDGTARITDFGIARATARVNSTRPGKMKGKFACLPLMRVVPKLMAAEQLKDGRTGARSTSLRAAASFGRRSRVARCFMERATQSRVCRQRRVENGRATSRLCRRLNHGRP